MCKKFLSIMLTLMMILSAVSVNVSADTAASQTKVIVSGSTLSALSNNNDYSSMASDVTFISDSSLKLTGTKDNSHESKRYKFAAAQDWTDYTYINVMAKNALSDGTSTASIYLCVQGVEASTAYGFWSKMMYSTSNDWTVVSVPLSAFAQGYNGDITEGDKYSEMNTITGMFFDYINGEFYVDSIWLSTELPAAATCTETSVADGSEDVLADTKEYSFTYSASLAPSSKQNPTVTITEDGEEFTGEYAVSTDEDQLKVTFAEMLKPGTEYSIDVSGVYDSFGIVAEAAHLGFTTSTNIVFPDEVVIADFTKLADIEKGELDVDTTNKLFGEKSGTFGEEKISAGPNIAPITVDGVTAPTDWSKYTHFNFWMYSEEVNSDIKFVMVLRTPGTSGNSAYKVLKQDFAGWKKFSIPLSDFGKGPNFDITNVQDAYVSYTFSSINGTWDASKYKKVSFAKMWLSTDAATVTDVTKEVYNSNSTSTTRAQLTDTATNKYAVLSSEDFDSNDQSLKLTGTGVVGCASRDWVLHSDQSSEDWSSYNYLNFRIKNASTNDDGSAKNGGFGFRMFSKAGGYWWKSNLHSITDTEWHTFTVKIPDDLVHSKASAESMNDIYALKLVYISGTMYLEKIWLSTEDPNAVVEAPNFESSSVSNGDVVSAYTHNIDFTYSKALDSDIAPTVTVAPEADYVVACENDTVQVIFPEALAAGTEYTVTVGGVSEAGESVTFSTENYSTGRSESAVYARYASSDYTSGKMFVATYNADDTLANVSVVNGTVTDGVLTISNDYVALDSTMSARIFVWEGATLRPLTIPVNFN